MASTTTSTAAASSSSSTPAAAPAVITLRHPQTQKQLEVVLGYSWAVALGGPVTLGLRGQWLLAAACVLLPLVGQILLAPSANKRYVAYLLLQGYRAVGNKPGDVTRLEWILGMRLPRY